jgi:thioredoxin 1
MPVYSKFFCPFFSTRAALLIIFLLVSLLIPTDACAGPNPFVANGSGGPSPFSDAVKDYDQKHYAQALTKLKACEVFNPEDAMVHYYAALCQQSLLHIDKAKQEYEWVVQHAPDGQIKALSAGAIANLDKTEYAVSHDKPPASQGPRKVKRIIEFYANWCPSCRTFGPVYEATREKEKFKDIAFDRINTDENKELLHQLGIHTIPRLVFMDSTGTVIYNGGCPLNEEGFAQLISNYR